MRILWVSRHKMTDEQISSLNKIYGDFELIMADKTFEKAEDIVNFIDGVDVYAVVLPVVILADLFKLIGREQDLIYSHSQRVPTSKKVINPATGAYELEYKFQHTKWQRITQLELLTEDLI
ncbi:MAG: hypothetical protein GX988_03700 [Clostridiales bacterium]|nr:hypothetical protein [Clostridiales bacterium]